ncbi:MAG: cation transporter [Desulfurococcales archaeon]|nr:cation transporter [Desulfurococcales archaeon]
MQEQLEGARIIVIALILGALGAVFKILGGILYGSKAVLIDGATCVGNIIAGVALYRSLKRSSGPPDEDHPFGHSRLMYHGILLVQVTYAFIAGLSAAILYYSYFMSYEVEKGAPIYAFIGTLFYIASILVSRRQGYAGAVFSTFTFTEVIEGAVTITASYVAYEYGKMYDLIGGLIILLYLLYELREESERLGVLISDYIDPMITRQVRNLLEDRGFKVEKLRIRTIVPGHYHGDAVVLAENMPYEVADLLVDEAVHLAKKDYNVDLVVHIDVPQEAKKHESR